MKKLTNNPFPQIEEINNSGYDQLKYASRIRN